MGLEAPPEVQGRVFGVAAAATALGFGLGTLVGGEAGALVSIGTGFIVAAAAALALSLLTTLAREPAR
jgi:hypothetical protein